MTKETKEPTRYRFGPREHGGGLAGWRAGQIVTVALGLAIGVLVLRARTDGVGVAMAVLVLALSGALATWPVSGRTGDQWLPVLGRWASRWASPGGRRRMDMLRGLRLVEVAGSAMGAVHDMRGRTLTAALSLRGQGFALLGPEAQDRRVAAWSSVLATLARQGSSIRRVQWAAASFPDQGHGVRSYVDAHAAADPASACVASYHSLLDDIDADACTHDVLLAVQVRAPRSLEAAAVVLGRELASLARLLADADIVVEGTLGVRELAERFERTYEANPAPVPPASAPDVGRGPGRVGGAKGSEGLDPWPMAMDEEWAQVRVDGLWHATFWVAEWPRTDVRSDFLAPLVLSSVRSVLSVVMEPLGPEKAIRKVEASRTADLADAELRRRSGFMSTARHSRQSEVLARREAELADGHASFRFSGYLTVSAPSGAELAAAVDATLHAASLCRLSIRRMYGDQAAAYTCTLPLGRGLAGR